MVIINNSGNEFDFGVQSETTSSDHGDGSIFDGERTDLAVPSTGTYAVTSDSTVVASGLGSAGGVEFTTSGPQPHTEAVDPPPNVCRFKWENDTWKQDQAFCASDHHPKCESDVNAAHPGGTPGQTLHVPCEKDTIPPTD